MFHRNITFLWWEILQENILEKASDFGSSRRRRECFRYDGHIRYFRFPLDGRDHVALSFPTKYKKYYF